MKVEDGGEPDELPSGVAERWLPLVRATTPARLFVGRAGGSYRTTTQLELRGDHAAAVDAVWRPLDPARDWGNEFLERWEPLEVASLAGTKDEYLRRPDLGRKLAPAALSELARGCPTERDLQIVVGDGLSAAAVARQVPLVLPRIVAEARERNWTLGRLVLVRHCRVGILNDIGECLRPRVVVLLIGERPGLATAESLSAYLAYAPRTGHTDALRNLISNIHARGVTPEQAAPRIVALAAQLLRLRTSGVAVKEEATHGEAAHGEAANMPALQAPWADQALSPGVASRGLASPANSPELPRETSPQPDQPSDR